MQFKKLMFRSGTEFQVYLTRSSGEILKKKMKAENISCIIVEDMGIGYIMNQVENISRILVEDLGIRYIMNQVENV